MSDDRAKHVASVGGLVAARDTTESSLALELGEHVFLFAAALQKACGFLDRTALVCDDAFIVVFKFPGLEKIELEDSLGLLGVGRANEEEAGLALPGLRLPALFEGVAFPSASGNPRPLAPPLD